MVSRKQHFYFQLWKVRNYGFVFNYPIIQKWVSANRPGDGQRLLSGMCWYESCANPPLKKSAWLPRSFQTSAVVHFTVFHEQKETMQQTTAAGLPLFHPGQNSTGLACSYFNVHVYWWNVLLKNWQPALGHEEPLCKQLCFSISCKCN